MDVTIYSLSDPRTNEIRYVGKTIMHHAARLKCHIYQKKDSGTYRTNWIQSLFKEGLKPIMEPLEVIENSNDEDWQEVERFWISYLKFLGCRLTNGDSGGNGGKRIPPEVRQRISDSMKLIKPKGQPVAPTCWLGRKHTEESKAKMSASLMGRSVWNKGLKGYRKKPKSQNRNKESLS